MSKCRTCTHFKAGSNYEYCNMYEITLEYEGDVTNCEDFEEESNKRGNFNGNNN